MFETAPDNDRMTNAKAGFALAAAILIAFLSIWNFLLMCVHPGRLPRPSFALILIAFSCLAGACLAKSRLLLLAFALAGAQAGVRATLWLAGVARGWQLVAALGGEAITVLASIMVIFVIVDWLKSVNRQHPPPDREKTVS